MSEIKAILHGKSHRKPYRGAKAVDASCRNHGDDDFSKGNRLYSATKRRLAAEFDDSDEPCDDSPWRDYIGHDAELDDEIWGKW
jgi:hypothetical protein